MSIISESSEGISSQLIIPNMRDLLPIEIRCSEREFPNGGKRYSLKNKGKLKKLVSFDVNLTSYQNTFQTHKSRDFTQNSNTRFKL